MLLQLDDIKKQKVYELANRLVENKDVISPQVLVLTTEKMKMIIEANSINEVLNIYNLDIKEDIDSEVRLNVDKADSLAIKYNDEDKNEIKYKALYQLFLNGLNWICAMRIWHCLNNNIHFTKNYLTVLKACYKKDGYCPCKIPHLDTYCPCVENLDEIKKDGHCHCNMFEK